MSYNVSNEMYHYGVKGMKWGKRKAIRDAYREGYRKSAEKSGAKNYDINIGSRKVTAATKFKSNRDRRDARYDGRHSAEMYKRSLRNQNKIEKKELTPEQKVERRKKAIKVGAAVAGTALAAYGAYKVNKYVKDKNAQIAAQRGYKASEDFFKSLTSNGHAGEIRKTITANPGKDALRKASESYNDSFGKAARNVVNYKRSGGNLKTLRSLNNYDLEDWVKVIETKYK